MRAERRVALGAAAAGALAAIALWGGAHTTTVESEQVVLHGTGTYNTTRREVDPAAIRMGFLALGGGITVALLLLFREPGAGIERATAIGALFLVAGTGFDLLRTLDRAPGEWLPGAGAFARRMDEEGLSCDPLRKRAVSDARHFRAEAICSVQSAVAYDDGRDDVAIGFFHDAAARRDWLRRERAGGAIAVVGPNWAATCEFRALCDLISVRFGALRTF